VALQPNLLKAMPLGRAQDSLPRRLLEQAQSPVIAINPTFLSSLMSYCPSLHLTRRFRSNSCPFHLPASAAEDFHGGLDLLGRSGCHGGVSKRESDA